MVNSEVLFCDFYGHQEPYSTLSKRIPSYKRLEVLAVVRLDQVGQLMDYDVIFDPLWHLRQSLANSDGSILGCTGAASSLLTR